MLVSLQIFLKKNGFDLKSQVSAIEIDGEYIIAVEKDSKIYFIKVNGDMISGPFFIVKGFNPYVYYENGYILLTFSWNEKIQRLDLLYSEIETINTEPLALWDAYLLGADKLTNNTARRSNIITRTQEVIEQNKMNGVSLINFPEDFPLYHPTPTGLAFNGDTFLWNATAIFSEFLKNRRYRLYEDGNLIAETSSAFFNFEVKSNSTYSIRSLYDSRVGGGTFEGSLASIVVGLFGYGRDNFNLQSSANIQMDQISFIDYYNKQTKIDDSIGFLSSSFISEGLRAVDYSAIIFKFDDSFQNIIASSFTNMSKISTIDSVPNSVVIIT